MDKGQTDHTDRIYGFLVKIGQPVLRFVMSYPVFSYAFISILTTIIVSQLVSLIGYPSEHGDDIFDYTWGILLSIIATSVTTYVFMYESNRSFRNSLMPSEELTRLFESKVRNMLTLVSVMTIIVVCLGMVFFSPLIVRDGADSIVYGYGIFTGLSVGIVTCNLTAILAIIHSGREIGDMAINSEIGFCKTMEKVSYKEKTCSKRQVSDEQSGSGIDYDFYVPIITLGSNLATKREIEMGEFIEIMRPIETVYKKYLGKKGDTVDSLKYHIRANMNLVFSRIIESHSNPKSCFCYVANDILRQRSNPDVNKLKSLMNEISSDVLKNSICDNWTMKYLVAYSIINSDDELESAIKDFIKESSVYDSLLTYLHYTDGQAILSHNIHLPFAALVMTVLISNQNLSGLDFSRMSLNNITFTGCDMSGCDLSAADIDGCDFSDANLSNTKWLDIKAPEHGVLLDRAIFDGSVFGDIQLDDQSRLFNVFISNATLNRPTITKGQLLGLQAKKVVAVLGDFIECDMDDSTFKDCIFEQCFLGRHMYKGIWIYLDNNEPKQLAIKRIEIVNDGVVIYDTVQPVPLWISYASGDNLPIRKRDVELILSDFNADPDWEARPHFDLEIIDKGDCYCISIKKLIKKPAEQSAKHNKCIISSIPICSEGRSEIGCDLEGSQLENTNVWNSKVVGCNMRNIYFKTSSFFGSCFFDTDFSESNFQEFDMANSTSVPGWYVRCKFNSARLFGTEISNCIFIGCEFYDMVLENTIIDSCIFIDCRVGQINATDCTFIKISDKKIGTSDELHFERCRFINPVFNTTTQ